MVGKNTLLALDEALVEGWKRPILTLSADGQAMLNLLEGCKLHPYDDQTGETITHWVAGATIGIGYLIPRNEWDTYKNGIDQRTADALFAEILPDYEKPVNDYIDIKLEQHEFDALVMFTYNLGEGTLKGSSLRSLINSGVSRDDRIPDIKTGWLIYTYSQGRADLEAALLVRRKKEYKLYSEGVYSNG